VFAQEEAGTAVCVSSDGLLLTCAHCVAEDDEEPDPERLYWLLFASGQAVAARCVAWDKTRDLGLLRVVAAQSEPTSGDAASPFAFVHIAEVGPSPGDKLVCVGHPGSEDLEAAEPGLKTGYDVLHLSTGAFRGYADGQDLQDNSEIGALQHDCWTYWGHSGAPLFDRRSGRLVGLHSSWDDETAMRRGIALEAIVAFLNEKERCY
jgi:S1-C subfamily serine protease